VKPVQREESKENSCLKNCPSTDKNFTLTILPSKDKKASGAKPKKRERKEIDKICENDSS